MKKRAGASCIARFVFWIGIEWRAKRNLIIDSQTDESTNNCRCHWRQPASSGADVCLPAGGGLGSGPTRKVSNRVIFFPARDRWPKSGFSCTDAKVAKVFHVQCTCSSFFSQILFPPESRRLLGERVMGKDEWKSARPRPNRKKSTLASSAAQLSGFSSCLLLNCLHLAAVRPLSSVSGSTVVASRTSLSADNVAALEYFPRNLKTCEKVQ